MKKQKQNSKRGNVKKSKRSPLIVEVKQENPTPLASMSKWQPPLFHFERKTVFCMTKEKAHEVYNLSFSSQGPRLLNEEDFLDED